MTQQQDSNPDPSPLGSLSKRDFLRLAPLSLLVALTGSAQAAHLSDAPFPGGSHGIEVIRVTGDPNDVGPTVEDLEAAWNETYHILGVDTNTGDRYYAESGDTTWSQLSSGGGSMFGYDTIVSTSTDYTASPGELVLADASGGAIEVTLPTHTTGDVVGVKKIDTTSNAVDLVRGNSADNVDLQRGIRLNAEDEFAGVISDGGSNWWSFNEVGSFTTLVGDDVIDDFEDQDLSEYEIGDTSVYDIVDGSAGDEPAPIEGSWMLRHDDADTKTLIASTGGLNNYFGKGETMTCRVYDGDERAAIRVFFGLTDINHFYFVDSYSDGNAIRIAKKDGAGNFSFLSSVSVTIPTFEWLKFEVDWASDNTITFTLFDESGTEIASTSVVDSAHAGETGVGFQQESLSSGTEPVFWDNLIKPGN